MADGKARDDRTIDDLERAVRSLTRHFNTDTVIVIGSQAILLTWPQAPVLMRTSHEIDAYPANNKIWEQQHPGHEASEEINALFGYGSKFHDEFGFYIDGVDESTASLPPGWRDRCQTREWNDGGKKVRAIAPGINDLVVSKLHRLIDKDRDYIRACHQRRPLDIEAIKALMTLMKPNTETKDAAFTFLDQLSARSS